MLRFFFSLVCLASSAYALKLGIGIELAPSKPEDSVAAAALKGEDAKYAIYAYPQNFYQAHEFCLQREMDLASFDDDEEYNHLTTLIKEKGGEPTVGYWTSGNDLGQKDHFVFFSTGRMMAAPHWHEGEPSHTAEGAEEAHCVALHGAMEYQASLVPCSQAMYVVCEKEVDHTAHHAAHHEAHHEAH